MIQWKFKIRTARVKRESDSCEMVRNSPGGGNGGGATWKCKHANGSSAPTFLGMRSTSTPMDGLSHQPASPLKQLTPPTKHSCVRDSVIDCTAATALISRGASVESRGTFNSSCFSAAERHNGWCGLLKTNTTVSYPEGNYREGSKLSLWLLLWCS